ncbi:FAD-dependent oxidoreductase [Candidatus Nitrosocosmicus arcticus]|uniref:Thioredoxin reductase n=1 Tax=Candidatus Nitrosocosmicus arcticus TaxID=2035267 RepID=A0A557SWA6_9ARCH|nr:FAD-dependent oxidoreductase [Candidatus Nitrosocosmicus arcticus]TVP40886.1 thioredoxin reductase [Candidatus Nitrosocosmicus arcticus]
MVVCSNGNIISDPEIKDFKTRGVKIMEQRIKNLVGQNGLMEQIFFENGETISRKAGFVLLQYLQSSDFGKQLGCENDSMGGIATDTFGRTNIHGAYAAGDASKIFPYGIIYAAAEGSLAAVGVNTDLTQQDF